MAYTEDQLVSRVLQRLQDSGTAIWSTAEIGQVMDACLLEVSYYKPRVVLATVTTTANSKQVDISSLTDLLYGTDDARSFEYVEFPTDKDPPRYRNFEVRQGKLIMDISFAPSDGEDVRLYCRQPHVVDGTTTNTLDPYLEGLLVDLCAGRAAISKSIDYVNQVTVGGQGVTRDYQEWGSQLLTVVLRRLMQIQKPQIIERWPQVA